MADYIKITTLQKLARIISYDGTNDLLENTLDYLSSTVQRNIGDRLGKLSEILPFLISVNRHCNLTSVSKARNNQANSTFTKFGLHVHTIDSRA